MRTLILILLFAWSRAPAQDLYFHPIVSYQLGPKKLADLKRKVTEVVQSPNPWGYTGPAWDSADYKRLLYPTYYLTGLKAFRGDTAFFKPTVLSVSEVTRDHDYLLRVAYIGRLDSAQTAIRAIASIGARWGADSQFHLMHPLGILTSDWTVKTVGPITFHLPPGQLFNAQQAAQSDSFSTALAGTFGVTPVAFDYYRCRNREQVYQLRGYDFHQDMYLSGGIFGMADAAGRILYAANNSLFYPHEISHLYVAKLLDGAVSSPIVIEGAATYFGGSSGYAVDHHLNVLSRYVREQKHDRFQSLLNRGEMLITEETNLSKALGALMVKLVWEQKGMPGLKALISTPDDKIVAFFGTLLKIKNPDAFLLRQAKAG